MADERTLEIRALLDLSSKVGELGGKLDSLIVQNTAQSLEIKELADRLRATELSYSNKRRPILFGLSGGGVAAAAIAIIEKLVSS